MKKTLLALLLAGCCHPLPPAPPIIKTVVETVQVNCIKALGPAPSPAPFTFPIECMPGKVCWEPAALAIFLANYEALREWADTAQTVCKD